MDNLIPYHEFLDIALYLGEAAAYTGPRPDLVLTNPYGPLPRCLEGVPMLLHQWFHRAQDLAAWVGRPLGDLKLIALWNRDREAVWTLNIGIPVEVSLADLVPTEEGWWPEALPRRLLEVYGQRGGLLWDGFCGRCTGGKAALAAGMRYIGIDARQEALDAARDYLGLVGPGPSHE